jgi:Fe-S-cluster containining protein
MPLTEADVAQLKRMGHDAIEFTVQAEGEVRLANVRGSCFFLENGRCRVYEARPEGCRVYPVVYDERIYKFVLDPTCPHGAEFSVTREDRDRLKRLLHRIDREMEKRRV